MKGVFFDKDGNKVSKRDFVSKAKDNVKTNYFSRQEIVSTKLLSDAQLDKAIESKVVSSCLFRGRTYYSKEDVMKLIAENIKAGGSQSRLL
ncbi:MAG: hypothetical protein Q8Q05_00495 [bacterium]|nr:hypothetical protein [bacterium]